MKKEPKKIMGILVMLVIMMTSFVTGCSSEATPRLAPIVAPSEENYYVKSIMLTGEDCYAHDTGKHVSNAEFVQVANEISIEKFPNGDFNVYTGMSMLQYKKEKNLKKIEKSNVTFLEEEDVAYANAKKRVLLFIDNTSWFEDKEALKNHIQNIPLAIADCKYDTSSEGEVFALYDAIDNTTYRNAKISEQMYEECAEHLYTHELIHALCTKTNGGDENKRFVFGYWDEIQTEAVAMALKSYASNKYRPTYQSQVYLAYEYFYIMGENGLKSYFYGYDECTQKHMNELDAFAECLESYWTDERTVSDPKLLAKIVTERGTASAFLIRWARERGVS